MTKIIKRVTSIVLTFVMVLCTVSILGTIDSNAAKKKQPKASDYAAVFDATYYANKYPDLKAVFGTDTQKLLNHFVNNGMAEGRQGNEEFNVQAYKARYADLQAAFGNDLKKYYLHYITSGKAEGRNGKAAAVSQVPSQSQKTPATQTVTPAAPSQNSSYQDQVVALVNQDRANNGLPALSTTPELMAAAQARANELVTYYSHTRPDGSRCFTIFSQYGVRYGYAGENIAAGQNTPAFVEDCWMNSTGHRANILSSNFRHIGVGYVEVPGGYGTYWVQMFTD